MSNDRFPDDLLEDQEIVKKMVLWIRLKLAGEPVEDCYKSWKFVLFSKTKSIYPKINEVRPISIFSPVYKALEDVW